MNMRSMVVMQCGVMLLSMAANAVTRNDTIRIKVLSSEARASSLDDSGVPKNCDMLNYDAYCNSSRATQVTYTLLAQEGNGAPFRMSCTVDSKLSRCASLPTGESFDAKREKHGIVVFYEDDRGKPRKQLYELLEPSAHIPAPSQVAVQSKPILSRTEDALRAAVAPVSAPTEAVQCNFYSNPSGADITLDGSYVGSTPSVLKLSPGVHTLVITMPGFAHWNRALTVSSGGVITVNAVLEKGP